MVRFSSFLRARRGEWAVLGALLACYPVSFILPAAWSREGGVLENLQVLVLGLGCVLALRVYLRARPAGIAMLALWVAPVWLLLAGRELSWGRAWLQQPGADGVLASHPLAPLVWPAAALLLGWLFVIAWRYRIDLPLRAALARHTPWLCLLVVLGAAMGSTCAEGHMSCHMDLAASTAQLFEELNELLAYVSLCVIQHMVLRHPLPHPQVLARGRRLDSKPEEVHQIR